MTDGPSAIRCAGCGAGLEVKPGAATAKCAFCGMEHSLGGERGRVIEVEATRIPPAGGGVVEGRFVGLAVERALLAQAVGARAGAFGCLWFFFVVSTVGMAASGQWRGAAIWALVLAAVAWAWGAPRRRMRRRIAEIDRQLGREDP